MQNIHKHILKELLKEFVSPNTALNMVGKYAENSTYVLEVMESTNDDYILINKCFDEISSNGVEFNLSKVYRVGKRGEMSEQKSDNLMLFHGTSRVNAVGILEEGFKPSTRGKHGPGVYLTESSICAGKFSANKCWEYSVMKQSNSGLNDGLMFIFLNEILESEKIKENVVEKLILRKTASPRKNQFEKYVVKGTGKKHTVENYGQDSKGRKLRTFAPSEEELKNYFVCHEKFVKPRYLIQCFPKFN